MSDATPRNLETEPSNPSENQPSEVAESSDGWRSVWRIHFYAGIFSIPFILLMAVTGLVILYTQPIQDWTQGDLRVVASRETRLTYDEQVALVADRFPDASIVSMTKPVDESHSTIFGLDDGSAAGRQAFVDPYRGEVLGSVGNGDGIVGLSNRLHGTLNNDSFTLDLPTVSALWDDGPLMRPYVIGDLVLELLGIWTFVLVASGLFLWWPRASRRRQPERRVLGVRPGARGRALWRDLHGVSGILLASILVITIVSGLAWSTYWGAQFSSIADEITPNSWTDAPASAVGERGDLDRLGNQINWNTGDRPIPASYATPSDGSAPAPIALSDLVQIADDEGMKPGYTIYFPSNTEDDNGQLVYGSFTVSNSWPRKTNEARDLYLDQFTGQTLAEQDVYGYGGVSRAMDTLVSVHMGTQLGIVNRVVMSLVSVLAIFSVLSATVMYGKRRRKRTLGFPRRPLEPRLANGAIICAVSIGVFFPIWGLTALAILATDRFVIRRVGSLRAAFGQRG